MRLSTHIETGSQKVIILFRNHFYTGNLKTGYHHLNKENTTSWIDASFKAAMKVSDVEIISDLNRSAIMKIAHRRAKADFQYGLISYRKLLKRYLKEVWEFYN